MERRSGVDDVLMAVARKEVNCRDVETWPRKLLAKKQQIQQLREEKQVSTQQPEPIVIAVNDVRVHSLTDSLAGWLAS